MGPITRNAIFGQHRGGIALRTVLAGALAAGALAAVASDTASASSPASPASIATGDGGRHQVRDVSANLFEWNWPSVARECTNVLGPAGYGSVQVAPPQDSLRRTALGDGSNTVLHPWWEVYQPVDYNLTSRMGTETQFKSMVATCRRAGVKVIVDAVINHMTGQGHVSYGGVTYTKYNYTGLYNPSDFHAYPADCPIPPDPGTGSREGNITDFNDYRQVFKCELVGLSDLRTETTKVRRQLAAYLNKLISYGVSGFRVDAAKHIGQPDLAAIEALLHRTVDGTRPYLALEVSTGSPGRISPWAFQSVGNLLGFDYATQIHDAFKSYNSPPNDGNIGDLKIFGTGSGLLPSNKELVWIQNHDTERNGSTLNYKDKNNVLANEFMLAWPHGTPQVYSSFAWTTPDDSPPADDFGRVTDTNCSNGQWVCVDRNRGVLGMVRFHNYVDGARVTNWYDDGINLIAFSRGDRGFFSGNNTAAAKTVTVHTSLAPGRYCDVVHGTRRANGTCSGPTVTVNRSGNVTITVGAYDAVALIARDRVA
jgi:alpha-amylase